MNIDDELYELLDCYLEDMNEIGEKASFNNREHAWGDCQRDYVKMIKEIFKEVK